MGNVAPPRPKRVPVSPQNLVERAIIDVSILRVRLATLMRHLLCALLATARSSLRPQRELAIENLALRQQLAILKRTTKRPRLTNADRAFWVALCGLWSDWQHALLLVKPETVIGWHRKGFKLFWTWKSRTRGGRPRIDTEIQTLIRRMALENPTWGAPRIHGELLKLGFEVTEATVSRYMPRRRKPPSQSWRAFLRNHTKELVSVDFFVVPTATFRILYVFVVLEHERRRIVHFNVTEGPSAQWTGRSSPSRWSAACIIATHDAQLEPKPRSHNEPRA